jgi:hypothetical protein
MSVRSTLKGIVQKLRSHGRTVEGSLADLAESVSSGNDLPRSLPTSRGRAPVAAESHSRPRVRGARTRPCATENTLLPPHTHVRAQGDRGEAYAALTYRCALCTLGVAADQAVRHNNGEQAGNEPEPEG